MWNLQVASGGCKASTIKKSFFALKDELCLQFGSFWPISGQGKQSHWWNHMPLYVLLHILHDKPWLLGVMLTSLFYDAEFKVLVGLKTTNLFTVCKIDLFLLRLSYQITPPWRRTSFLDPLFCLMGREYVKQCTSTIYPFHHWPPLDSLEICTELGMILLFRICKNCIGDPTCYELVHNVA